MAQASSAVKFHMQTPQPIKNSYAELSVLPIGADAEWKRARGYKFEKLLTELLRSDNLVSLIAI
jgi:hypothetical protein